MSSPHHPPAQQAQQSSGGTRYVAEPWDTPDRENQARAHERAMAARHRRQSLVLLAVVLTLVLVFIAALAMFKGWIGGSPTANSPTPCPKQTVARPADTSVRVLNSTTRKGLAGNVAKTLKARGYTINAVGNAQRGTAGSAPALIVYGAGGVERARSVAAHVAGAKLRGDARTSTTVDLIIGDKFSAVRSAKDAAPLLKQIPVPAGCVSAS